MERKTILQIRNELGIYNNILNMYVKIFGMRIFSEKYLFSPNVYDLRDYHEIKDELYYLLISQKDKIQEFSKDYYKWKSPKYISEKIGINLNILLSFLNMYKLDFLEAEGTIDIFDPKSELVVERFLNVRKMIDDIIFEDTEIKKISSYGILKRIENLN
ncbi:hypothetical protein [Flavobacterium sp.]|uniref:hypothetical protein n=1 Tax=Flavobacterium sp. TaxID=239 RepID=UPI00374FFB8A